MTLGIQTLETGVFGGVVIGLVTCTLHSRFNKVSLPQFLGFSGSRFVPIISSLAAIVVGAVMTVVWPHFQKLILTGRPGGCDGLSGDAVVRLHPAYAWSTGFTPYLLFAVLDDGAGRQ